MIFLKKDITKKLLSFLLVTIFVMAVLPLDVANAYVSEVDFPKKVDSFTSSNYFKDEVLNCRVTKSGKLIVEYHTPLKADCFNVSFYRVGENKGDVGLNLISEVTTSIGSNGKTLYGFKMKIDPTNLTITPGKYNLYLRRGEADPNTGEINYAPNSILYKNMEFKLDDNGFNILRYNQVIETNKEIQLRGAAYPVDKYLDNTLEDIKFVLRDPLTRIYDTMTDSKIQYIKSVSDKVCHDAVSDYDKLIKIYEYTAGNFYYDTIAFKEHRLQYANPYNNIYSFENETSQANASQGKVATTCQGFAAIFLALSRAQNIPTRFVYGHRLAVPSNDWITESGIDVLDHWWLECLINGRWIFVDPTVGTTSKYNKNSGIWQYSGVTNYTYFDPSMDQIATSHIYMNIFPDYRRHIFLENEYEKDVISNFLEFTGSTPLNYEDDFGYFSYGKSNGTLLNKDYTVFDLATWGDNKRSHFRLDGRGNVAQIIWKNRKLQGNLSFNDFKNLEVLNLSNNQLSKADLSGDSKLNRVYLHSNNLVSVNLTNTKPLNLVNLKNNPLKELSIKIRGKNRYFECGDNGTFSFNHQTGRWGYTTTLLSKPDIGYKVKGIYDDNGKKISSKKVYKFIPTLRDYKIEFTLNPKSFKYALNLNENAKHKVGHIQAVAKRLNELGYTTLDLKNVTSYDSTIFDAVTKFQVINDLLNTGNVDKTTWHHLFNIEAKAMTDSETYSTILSTYEAEKSDKLAIKDNLEHIDISLNGELTESKKIQLTWELGLANSNSNNISNVNDDESNDSNTAYDDSDSNTSSLTPETLDLIISKLDNFVIYRSTSKYSGFKKIKELKDGSKRSFIDNDKLKANTTYYYKMVTTKTIFGEEYTSQWSNITKVKTPKVKKSKKGSN